jgi:hypothetical protein
MRITGGTKLGAAIRSEYIYNTCSTKPTLLMATCLTLVGMRFRSILSYYI